MKTLSSALTIAVASVLLMGVGCSDNATNPMERNMSLSAYGLEFVAWAGFNPNPAQQKIRFFIEGTVSATWSATVTGDWLRIGPSGSATIFVTVISENIAAGLYQDTITVESPEATNSPLRVIVDLTVLNRVTLSPEWLSFSGPAGGETPPDQNLVIAEFGGQSVSFTATTQATWLVPSVYNSVVPDTIAVGVNIIGMTAGHYEDSIVVISSELPESRAVVPCYLNLSSWSVLSLGPGTGVINLEGLEFVDASSGWASGWLPSYAAEPYGKVYRTTDGGFTWTEVLNRLDIKFGGLAAIDANRCWVVGDSADIELTTDGGATWTRKAGLPVADSVELSDVFFADEAYGWAVGGTGTVVHTADSGQTWSLQQTPTTFPLSGVVFLDTQTGWASGNHGTILHTGDGGTTWIAQSTGTIHDIRSVSFVNNLLGWAVGSAGLILRTIDGGAVWSSLSSGTSQILLDVSFVSSTRGWVVGAGGVILHTNDGGETWFEQTPSTTDALTEVFFLDDNLGWIVGDLGIVLKTASGGF